jgi:hypothetical protein
MQPHYSEKTFFFNFSETVCLLQFTLMLLIYIYSKYETYNLFQIGYVTNYLQSS